MPIRKLAPALAVGATVVLKVPAETPFSVLALIEASFTICRLDGY